MLQTCVHHWTVVVPVQMLQIGTVVIDSTDMPLADAHFALLIGMQEKLRRQQRDVEHIAFEARQRIMSEEARLRELKAEMTKQSEVRQDMLTSLEQQLQLRLQAITGKPHNLSVAACYAARHQSVQLRCPAEHAVQASGYAYYLLVIM